MKATINGRLYSIEFSYRRRSGKKATLARNSPIEGVSSCAIVQHNHWTTADNWKPGVVAVASVVCSTSDNWSRVQGRAAAFVRGRRGVRNFAGRKRGFRQMVSAAIPGACQTGAKAEVQADAGGDRVAPGSGSGVEGWAPMKSFEELLNESEVKDWLFRAERDMFPKMEHSAMSLIINSDRPDAKLALEIGAAILFDKPLIVVVLKGTTVPANLRRVANAVVEIDDFQSVDGQRKLKAAIDSTLESLAQGGRPADAAGKA